MISSSLSLSLSLLCVSSSLSFSKLSLYCSLTEESCFWGCKLALPLFRLMSEGRCADKGLFLVCSTINSFWFGSRKSSYWTSLEALLNWSSYSSDTYLFLFMFVLEFVGWGWAVLFGFFFLLLNCSGYWPGEWFTPDSFCSCFWCFGCFSFFSFFTLESCSTWS